MYKKTSQNMQRRAESIALRELASLGDLNLTPQERLESLQARYRQVGEEIKQAPKGSPKRRQLGLLTEELKAQIILAHAEVKKSRPANPAREFKDYFMICSKQILQPGLYESVKKAAFKMLDDEALKE